MVEAKRAATTKKLPVYLSVLMALAVSGLLWAGIAWLVVSLL